MRVAKSCVTGDCFFTIVGLDTSPTWSLLAFSRSTPLGHFGESLQGILGVAHPAQTFAAIWTVGDVLRRSDFTVSAVRANQDGTLEGDYSVTVPKGDEYFPLEGTCRIDPRQHGIVVDNKYVLGRSTTYRTTLRRKITSINSHIVCTNLTVESTNVTNGVIEFSNIYSFDNFTVEPPAKEIFTLEHYGIPTPDDDLVPWYSRWQVWAALAVSGLVLAVVFRRLAVRRRVR